MRATVRPSDTELVGRCLRREEGAWDELLARYRALIYTVPRRAGLSVEDSAEVFQTVCMELFLRLPALRDPERLGAWLVTTSRREAWLVARRARRREALARGEDLTVLSETADDPAPLADEECERIERAQILRDALETLPERCRAILGELLREDGERSYTDMAESLGIPRGSLGPTRARCLDRLRRELKLRGVEE